MSKFEVYKDRKSQFRWRYRASNNRIIAASTEGYRRKKDCMENFTLLIEDLRDIFLEQEQDKKHDVTIGSVSSQVSNINRQLSMIRQAMRNSGIQR